MVLLIALFLMTSESGKCVLTEGVGADFGTVEVTTRGERKPSPPGVILQYKGDVLVQIFVTNNNCQTLKGVRIGSTQKEVESLYGKGKKINISLMKGMSDSLGNLGDIVLEYPGVSFVISKEKVAAFFITSPKGPSSACKRPKS